MAFGQISFVVLQFLGSVAIARLLTPYDTGIFAIAMAVVGLLAIIQAMGLNNFLIREETLTHDLIATAFTVNAGMSLILAVLVATLGLIGGALFGDPGVRQVLLVLAIVPLIGQLAFLPNAMLEREGAFKTLALLRTVSTAIGLVLTISFAATGFRYMSLAYSQVGTALITNLTLLFIARRHVRFRFSLSHWTRVSQFGMQIFAVSGITRMAQRLSEIALGRLLGLQALGLYSRAAGNYNLIWDNIHTVATRVLFVDFASLKRQGIPLRDRYLQVVTVITALLWPAFLGVAVVAGPLVRAVYGERWIGAATPLSLLCIAGVLQTSITMTWEVFVVSGETGRQARIEFIRTLVGLGLFIAGCMHSLPAAAAAKIGDAIFAQLLYRPHLHRMTEAQPRELVTIYLRSGALAAAAVLPAAAVMTAWGWSSETPLLPLAIAVATGVSLWLLLLRRGDHVLHRELAGALRRLRPAERRA